MSRKGCPNKIQTGIRYPRKCDHCGYLSNNPSMYSYHKQTHEPIPDGQLCDRGCGQPAMFRGTGGKYTCLSSAFHCPNYISKHSERIAGHWENADERKQKTKETFVKHCVNDPDVRAKQKVTLKKKWGDFTPEQMKDFRHYARRIRQRAQKWARDNGYNIGQQTYHVDHKLSIRDAWLMGLSENVVNHPANLQILEAKKNSSKGAKSVLTLEELLKQIDENNTTKWKRWPVCYSAAIVAEDWVGAQQV